MFCGPGGPPCCGLKGAIDAIGGWFCGGPGGFGWSPPLGDGRGLFGEEPSSSPGDVLFRFVRCWATGLLRTFAGAIRGVEEEGPEGLGGCWGPPGLGWGWL